MIDVGRIERAVRDGGMDGLRVFAERLIEQTKPDVPVGNPAEDPNLAVELRESALIEEHANSVVVGFNTVYATVQHEALDYEHPYGGEAKFLENNFKQMLPGLERTVGEAVGRRLDANTP